MTLKEKIAQRENAAGGTLKTTYTPPVPVANNYKKRKPVNTKKRIIWISVPILSFLLLFIASVYLPQLFIFNSIDNKPFGTRNTEAISTRAQILNANPTKDFDGDGLSNKEELDKGTDPYRYDSDGDGVPDGNDSRPLEFSLDVVESLKNEGISTKSAYEMNGVLMWADNDKSLAVGGVILLPNGNYRFTGFTGWVSFGNENIAYKHKDGIHSEMKHRETEDAWYVDEDCEVTLVRSEPEQTHKFTIFGNRHYLEDNPFSNILSSILPSKGWITSEKMWISDTFVNKETYVFANNLNISTELDMSRFSHNDLELSDITVVYRTIEKGDAVCTTLFNQEAGETVLLVVGYTTDGHLIVTTDSESEETEIIYIQPQAAKELTDNGKVIVREWYEFKGCGYNSKNGDTISFFASSKLNDIEVISDEPNAMVTTPPDTAPTEPTLPENGMVKAGENDFYYIDNSFVTDSVIRLKDGKYEYCKTSDSGAFYVDENGIKADRKVKIGNNTYLYNDGFYKSCFVTISDPLSLGSQYTDSTVYVDSSGAIVYGWFSYGGDNLYASTSSGYIAHNCFVNTSNGTRYVGKDGYIVKNKLITVSGIEVIIDETGKIVNESYAINAINGNLIT